MFKDNVTPMKFGSVTLDIVRKTLNAWRLAKTSRSEKIPMTLWHQIVTLLNKHTEAELCSVLSITTIQLDRGKQLVHRANLIKEPIASDEVESIDFCKAAEEAEEHLYPLAYKPAEAFATNTSIVELRRPDGMLMKIHICTDRFEELLRAFFKG